MARYIVYYPIGETAPQRMKYIDDATAAPDANDDAATLGVTKGSLWLDTTNGNTYVCHDPSTGAAVWKQLGGVGASDSSSLFTDLSVSGATTVDRADGATHDLTLTGNATITLDGAITGEATDWRLIVRQDGAGNRTITWADTITWAGGSAPTLQTGANAVDVIGLVTVDDGATYLGFHAAGGGGGATTLDGLTDVDTDKSKTPADGDVLTYDGTHWNAEAATGGASSLDDLSDVDLTTTTPSDGDILIYDSVSGNWLPDTAAAASVTAAAVKAVGRWEPVQFDSTDTVVYFDEGSPPMPFVYFNGEIVVAFVET